MMTNGITDLFHSERGVWAIAVLLLVTVLVIIGKVTGEQWLDLVKYLSVAILASKTITTAVETYATKQSQIPRVEVVSDSAKS